MLTGRARGRRGPHRGGSVKPSPSSSTGRDWIEMTFDAVIFGVLALTIMVLLAPMGRAAWALIAHRGH